MFVRNQLLHVWRQRHVRSPQAHMVKLRNFTCVLTPSAVCRWLALSLGDHGQARSLLPRVLEYMFQRAAALTAATNQAQVQGRVSLFRPSSRSRSLSKSSCQPRIQSSLKQEIDQFAKP
jgi:hypothetical protein